SSVVFHGRDIDDLSQTLGHEAHQIGTRILFSEKAHLDIRRRIIVTIPSLSVPSPKWTAAKSCKKLLRPHYLFHNRRIAKPHSALLEGFRSAGIWLATTHGFSLGKLNVLSNRLRASACLSCRCEAVAKPFRAQQRGIGIHG